MSSCGGAVPDRGRRTPFAHPSGRDSCRSCTSRSPSSREPDGSSRTCSTAFWPSPRCLLSPAHAGDRGHGTLDLTRSGVVPPDAGRFARASRSRSTSSARCTPTPRRGSTSSRLLNDVATACFSRFRTTRAITPDRPIPAPVLDRRAAAADQRAQGRHVPRRSSPAAAESRSRSTATTSVAGCSCGPESRVSGRSVAAPTCSGSNQCDSTCATSRTGP